MNAKELTKREPLLRQRAARLMEKTSPDQIRRTNGDTAGNEREGARTLLVARGHLTQHEIDTLPVDEAIAVAPQRVRD